MTDIAKAAMIKLLRDHASNIGPKTRVAMIRYLGLDAPKGVTHD